MAYPYNLPDIEKRFLPDDSWKIGEFTNQETNHNIHYSYSLTNEPIGTVIILPGLSEFSEKYIETVNFFNKRNYNCYVIDWAYQGRSSRFKKNNHKRYSDGYNSDISDLNKFIKNFAPNETPLYMLGHSMGAHIGLRYLATQNHNIKAASFSTPMLGILDLKYFPLFLSYLFKPFSSFYVPGGKNWHEGARKNDGTDIFSSDPIRDAAHTQWCLANSELQIGNATFKWLNESLKSISFLKKRDVLDNIKIPTLLAYAGKETLVDNDAIKNASMKIKSSIILELKNSKHEILMETDDIRDEFLNKTLALFNQQD